MTGPDDPRVLNPEAAGTVCDRCGRPWVLQEFPARMHWHKDHWVRGERVAEWTPSAFCCTRYVPRTRWVYDSAKEQA